MVRPYGDKVSGDEIDITELEVRLFPDGKWPTEVTPEESDALLERFEQLLDQYGEEEILAMDNKLRTIKGLRIDAYFGHWFGDDSRAR